MAKLEWDKIGERFYETGVDRGVYYPQDLTGAYIGGVAWNGLVSVNESPSGAEANPQYADNIKYLNLVSAEEFGATIEAFTYPPEFAQSDGIAEPVPGLSFGQQARRPFGLCYRSLLGNDTQGTDYGYKLNLVYGALATPSEKSRTTVNESPEAMTMSWELTTTPVAVGEVGGVAYRPLAFISIKSTEFDEEKISDLEAALYGSEEPAATPYLPTPAEVYSILAD